MNKSIVIQRIINSINAQSYLEIGVERGNLFNSIVAPNKYGVDPNFQFNTDIKINRKKSLSGTSLYKISSDKFFDEFAPRDLTKGIDVAFVDGLHTYDQSLRDVKNCLSYLNEAGIIIMHDCNPLNYASAYPVRESIDEVLELAFNEELPGWNGCWNGDVWKTLVHLRLEYDDLKIFTLDLDWGLGIITKGKSSKLEGFTVEMVRDSNYWLLEEYREELLNLKHPKYLRVFLDEVKTLSS